MSTRERLRREDPVRTRPIRNWSALCWPEDPARTGDPSAHQGPAGSEAGRSPFDAVAHGVKLGYKVIDEHISQGQRIAREINDRTYETRSMGNDLWEFTERTLAYYGDLTSMWLKLMGSFAEGDALRNPFASGQGADGASVPPPRSAGNDAPPDAEPLAVSIEVSSARPARVTLELHPRSEALPLATHGLRALDPEKPPLTDVAFETDAEGRPSLSIRVPEDQAADLYTGVVVDRNTGQSRGTLSVRVTG